MQILALIASLFVGSFAQNIWQLQGLDGIRFEGVRKTFANRYWLSGQYGPNNLGWFGRYAYIYMEVGGGEIQDEAVIATYATIFDTDYIYNINENITAQYTAKGDFETAECRVRFRHNLEEGLQGDVSTWADIDDVDVRTYKGLVNNLNVPSLQWEVDVWAKTTMNYDRQYRQEHQENGWEATSRAGCYMQRLADSYYSAFPIKNNVPYPVVLGYNMYNKEYDLVNDNLMDQGWEKNTPVFSGLSEVMDFTWWNVEGAFSAFTAGIAAIVAVLAF